MCVRVSKTKELGQRLDAQGLKLRLGHENDD